jgi:hypothetical protein
MRMEQPYKEQKNQSSITRKSYTKGQNKKNNFKQGLRK